MYRGVKFYEAAVKATNGELAREAVAAAHGQGDDRRKGPGGGAEMVPGKMHCKMNMYIAQSAKSTPARPATRSSTRPTWSIRGSADR